MNATIITHRHDMGRRPLDGRTMLRIVLVLSVWMAFGVAHLNLRFSVARARLDAQHLQQAKAELISEINLARSRNEALKQPERLLVYARRELGMSPLQPSDRETLRMPEDVYLRYAMVRRPEAPERRASERQWADAGEPFLDVLGERLGLSERAEAAE